MLSAQRCEQSRQLVGGYETSLLGNNIRRVKVTNRGRESIIATQMGPLSGEEDLGKDRVESEFWDSKPAKKPNEAMNSIYPDATTSA